jgi:hypothetical protein
VCHRQIRARSEFGFLSEYFRNLQFSHLDFNLMASFKTPKWLAGNMVQEMARCPRIVDISQCVNRQAKAQ